MSKLPNPKPINSKTKMTTEQLKELYAELHELRVDLFMIGKKATLAEDKINDLIKFLEDKGGV